MKKLLIGLACIGAGVASVLGQSVVVNEIRNDAPDAVELVVVQDGLNLQGMILKDYSSSGVNDGGGAFTFSSDALWASVPAGTIILLQKTNTATDVTVGGGDYNLAVGLQNATYFTAGSGTFDIATEEIIQIKAAGSGQAGSTGAIHTLATAGAGAQYDGAPTPKLKAASGNTGFQMSCEANNGTAALSDFNGTDATGGNATGTIGTYNNANNQTYIESLRGPATFGVTFDKSSGFEVEEGSSDVITATAANGTEPYAYAWSSTLAGAYYATNAGTFTILASAPLGDYSAEVIATDSDVPAQSVTNSLNFSVVAAPTYYGITINPTTNGTATTTPETQATAGATVTVNTSPAGGYVVESIVVNGGAVTVTGNTFTMPAEAVTITVTFQEAPAGRLVISQYTETDSGTIPKGIEIWNVSGADITFDAADNLLDVKVAANGTNVASSQVTASSGTLAAGAVWVIGTTNMNPDLVEPFTFNGDDALVLELGGVVQDVIGTVGVDPGTSWTNAGVSTANQNIQLKDGITTGDIDGWSDPSERFEYVAAGSDLTGFGEAPGGATFGVTFDQTSGFEVEEGTTDVIVATAANGTAPYTYGWSSTLGGTYYATNSNEFTILATAPVGDYSATVVATDSSDPVQIVTNSLDFSVVTPAVKYAIAIVTNDPAFGTVTTDPATEAAEGETVTVAATPASGYAVDSIVVNGGAVTVTGNTFTMPAEAVTVTVTFVEHEGSDLIISEVTDPADNANAKFVELYNASASTIDLAAGQWYLARQANGSTSSWASVALTGTVDAAQTYVVIYSVSNFAAAYPAAAYQQVAGSVVTGNGDDGYYLYSGGDQTAGTLEDACGVIDEDGTGKDWEYTDARAVRNTGVTAGNPTWTASEWTITDPANVADMTPGVHPDGPAVFGVSFDKTSGFEVEEGSSDAIVATAANGTEPYAYVWSSSLGGAYYTTNAGTFTILATAPIGDYSAQVIATDSSDPVQNVTNSLNFSVVTPPTKYAIAIVTNDPAFGTVTTDPATEAAAGVTVTVTATPAEGYAVESIVVNGGAVVVVGTAFTMPGEAAIVTVTFMEYEAPDVLIDFEDYTTNTYAQHVYNTAGVSFTMTNALSGSTAGTDRFNGLRSARFYHYRTAGNAAMMTQTAPFTQAITKLNFWFADYGTDEGGTFKVQVSDDGATWQDVGEAAYDPAGTTLEQGVIESLPANATYVQFVTLGESVKRVNIDDIGVYFGVPTFGVSVNKSSGFTVNEGQSDAITATAANGTEPYTYAWVSTLGSAYYATNANVFTILATAPTGSYSATVTATDATLATAQKTVTFSVVGLPPDQPAVLITGSLSGTVGVEMSLGVSVTNETANDWFIDLKDPDGLDDYSWGFDGSTFTLTPAKSGTYVLAVTAQTGSGDYSNVVNLAISGGGAEWQIGDVGGGGSMFYTASNQNFVIVLPTNYTLSAVYGSDSSSAGLNGLGQGLGSPLTQGVDYTWTPATRTISILSGVTNRRVLRIGATSP